MTSDPTAADSKLQRPQVQVFDHTLMWPVLLHDTRDSSQRPAQSGSAKLEEWSTQITSTKVWKQVDMTGDEDYRQPYEEVVYFHPFARKFLYDRPKDADPDDHEFDEGVRLFERNDIVGVKTVISRDNPRPEFTLTLAVAKVQLFLFDTFVAVAVIRLTNANGKVEKKDEAGRPIEVLTEFDAALREQLHPDDQRNLGAIDLDAVLAFQEVFRRCYPPFWKTSDKTDSSAEPGVSPKSVVWLMRNPSRAEPESLESDYPDQPKFRNFVAENVQSPVARHFQMVMEPLIPFRSRHRSVVSPRDGTIRWLAYRQILDERIPVMSYIAVDDPLRLTEADFFRLAFCDSPGADPGLFPYSIHSPDVKTFPGDFVYDRFWGPRYRFEEQAFTNVSRTNEEMIRDLDRLKKFQTQYTTRYLCSGFAFVSVGSVTDDDYRIFVRAHMKRHYFKLGLIAHFGRASLLAFDDRLAYAVQHRSSGDSWINIDSAEKTFRKHLKRIEDEFVTFRTRYWFSEVSNHMQAREIFDWWGRHLEVDTLFLQVKGKIHTVNEVLERQDTQELNKQVKWLTRWGLGITILSVLIAIFSAVRDVVGFEFCSPDSLWIVGLLVFLCVTVASLAFWNDLVKCIGHRMSDRSRRDQE